MPNPKLIAAGLVLLGMFGATWTARGWKAGRDIAEVRAELAKTLTRAEAAEDKVAELAEANTKLAAANAACNVAALAQSASSRAALARRDNLAEIMTCPAPQPADGDTKQKGELDWYTVNLDTNFAV